MNRQELLDYHERICADARKLMEDKNADYAGDSPSAFANFEATAALGICTVEQGMMVRLSDKLRRLSNFVRVGFLAVTTEKARDTIIDAINYLVIVAAWMDHKANLKSTVALRIHVREGLTQEMQDAIRAGLADTKSGRVTLAQEAFAEIDSEIGKQQAGTPSPEDGKR